MAGFAAPADFSCTGACGLSLFFGALVFVLVLGVRLLVAAAGASIILRNLAEALGSEISFTSDSCRIVFH